MNLSKIPVSSLLQEKGSSVYCTAANSTVKEAVTQMNYRQIGCLMVTDIGYPVGIFTERDVLARVVAADLDPKLTVIRDVMTNRFKSITEDASVEDAMQMLKEHRIRHLPVLNDNELLGMLSISDVNRWLLKVNEIEAENLRHYMFEAYPC